MLDVIEILFGIILIFILIMVLIGIVMLGVTLLIVFFSKISGKENAATKWFDDWWEL